MNAAQLLIDNLERFGEYPYVTFEDRTLSNAETIRRGCALATVLAEHGVGIGAPKELEEAIQEHPAVSVVAVVGIPDRRFGENICAVVKPKPGAMVTPDEIKAHTAGYVAKFKVPAHVVLLDDVPMTSSGKVQKNKLRERMAELLSPGS